MGLHTAVVVTILSLALVNASPVNLGIIDEEWDAFSMSVQKESAPEIQTHDAGDTFELHCQAKNADMVHWNYPSNNSVEDRITIQSRDFSDGFQLSVLTVRNATYEDTGSYKCSCGGIYDMDHFIKHQDGWVIASRKVYIFIRDDDRLLYGEPQTHAEFLMGVVQEDLTVPCKKTDPEANVMLYSGEGMMEYPISIDNNKYHYNNRDGFIIKQLRAHDSKTYTCTANKNNRTDSRKYIVRVLTSRPVMSQPIISVRDGHTVAPAGRTLPLKCQVAVGRHQLTNVKWFGTFDGETTEITAENRNDTTIDFEPTDPLCSHSRSRCSFMSNSRVYGLNTIDPLVKVTGRLRLGNMQDSDAGLYHCEVTSSQLVKESEQLQITVIEAAIVAVLPTELSSNSP